MEVGFLPQHNQIWFVSAGRIFLIDIKSALVIGFPFKGPEGSGEVKAPAAVSYVGFSPKGGMLAYAEKGGLTVVRGLATSRDREPLSSQVVMELGRTTDTAGETITGRIDSFAWLDDDRIAAVIASGPEAGSPASIYLAELNEKGVAGVKLLVSAPAGVSFSSISRAPAGTDFAVLCSNLDKLAISWYEANGKQVKSIKLPSGEWRRPLCWTSP
jgi:hypothetical protein